MSPFHHGRGTASDSCMLRCWLHLTHRGAPNTKSVARASLCCSKASHCVLRGLQAGCHNTSEGPRGNSQQLARLDSIHHPAAGCSAIPGPMLAGTAAL